MPITTLRDKDILDFIDIEEVEDRDGFYFRIILRATEKPFPGKGMRLHSRHLKPESYRRLVNKWLREE